MSYEIEWTEEDSEESVGNDGKRVRTHTRSGIVKPGSAVGTYAIESDCGHRIGEVHYQDSSATLRKIKATRNKETTGQYTAYSVALTYSTDAAEPNDDADPCSQRVKRSQGTVEQTLYIYKDRTGQVIANKAGQPFSGGVPVSIKLPTYVYEKNIQTYDRQLVSQWCNSLNQNSFNGCAAGTLQLGITADERFEGQFHYWAHRFEMAYVPFGWQPSPINAGLMQLIAGALKPILDPHTRQPVTDPWPLTTAGVALPDGYAPGDVNFIDVDFFRLKNYSQLGLQEF